MLYIQLVVPLVNSFPGRIKPRVCFAPRAFHILQLLFDMAGIVHESRFIHVRFNFVNNRFLRSSGRFTAGRCSAVFFSRAPELCIISRSFEPVNQSSFIARVFPRKGLPFCFLRDKIDKYEIDGGKETARDRNTCLLFRFDLSLINFTFSSHVISLLYEKIYKTESDINVKMKENRARQKAR